MENSAPRFLRTRLSLQMFLQFAIWGAWAPVLGKHLENIGFTGGQIGAVYSTGALATMVSPMIAGQIADRWFPTQLFIGISYLLSGVLFFVARGTTDYHQMYWLGFGTMLFFAPTLGLANSLCFHHLADVRRDFPFIRAWGTVGWIAASGALSAWMKMTGRPIGDCLTIAAIFSVINGFYSLTLPSTPPKRDAAEPFATKKVLGMLKDPSFAVFSFLAFALMVFATFYYFRAANFLPTVGISDSNLPLVLLIGQITEIPMMFLLPAVLTRLGSKLTISIGLAAWSARFAIFALGGPAWLIIAAQGIHGIAFAFAVAASMIYVERICSPDVRGSMQSFLSWLTYGLGMCVGGIIGGQVSDAYTVGGVSNWHQILMVPAIGCAAVTAAFVLTFRARDTEPAG